MAKKPSKLAIGCVVIIIMIATMILFVGYPFGSSTVLKISFVAYTNDVTPNSPTVFIVKNESSKDIVFAPCKPQLKNLGTWSKLDTYWDYVTNVSAHTSITFTVPPATSCEAWREPIYWAYTSQSKIETVRGNIRANLHFNWLGISRGGWPRYYKSAYEDGENHTVFSPEITNAPGK